MATYNIRRDKWWRNCWKSVWRIILCTRDHQLLRPLKEFRDYRDGSMGMTEISHTSRTHIPLHKWDNDGEWPLPVSEKSWATWAGFETSYVWRRRCPRQRDSCGQWPLGNESKDGGNYSDVEREREREREREIPVFESIELYYTILYVHSSGWRCRKLKDEPRQHAALQRQAGETRRANFAQAVTVLFSLPITRSRLFTSSTMVSISASVKLTLRSFFRGGNPAIFVEWCKLKEIMFVNTDDMDASGVGISCFVFKTVVIGWRLTPSLVTSLFVHLTGYNAPTTFHVPPLSQREWRRGW